MKLSRLGMALTIGALAAYGRVFAAWTQASELFLCERALTVAAGGTSGVGAGIFDPHP